MKKKITKSSIFRKSVLGKRSSRSSHSKQGEYHHAILGLTAVVIFLFAAIAMKFSARATGYAVAHPVDKDFVVTRAYTMPVYGCENYMDNYDPYSAGYIAHSGGTVSKDSCMDSSTLLEYSCLSPDLLKADIGTCKFGCVEDGAYGKCR